MIGTKDLRLTSPSEAYELSKIHTIAQIAARLIIYELSNGRPAPADIAAARATEIFEASEACIAGMVPVPVIRSVPEQLRYIRLIEKLRSNVLDSNERAELSDILEKGI